MTHLQDDLDTTEKPKRASVSIVDSREAHDTLRLDLETGKILDHVKFETGNLVMISH